MHNYQKPGVVYGKRFFDVLFSFLGILLASPIILILIILGLIFMGGHPFSKTVKIGKSAKTFKMILFRTKKPKKQRDDSIISEEERLSGYGKFLKKTKLNRIPLLFHILAGEMSFIGPEALNANQESLVVGRHQARWYVRPGMKSIKDTIKNENLEWIDKLNLELLYVYKISMGLDLKILFNTVDINIKGVWNKISVNYFHKNIIAWINEIKSNSFIFSTLKNPAKMYIGLL